MSDTDARRRARYLLRFLGAEMVRRWAEKGSLKHRVGDEALDLPVELSGADRSGLVRRFEMGETFEVDDSV